MGATQSVTTLPTDINNKGPIQVPYLADTEPVIITAGSAQSTPFSTTDVVVVRIKNRGGARGYIRITLAGTAATTNSFSLEALQDIFVAIRPNYLIYALTQDMEVAVCS
jgi:hypothetical protein